MTAGLRLQGRLFCALAPVLVMASGPAVLIARFLRQLFGVSDFKG